MKYIRSISLVFFIVICGVGLFAGGAYFGVRFFSAIQEPKFAQDTLVHAIEDHALLTYLDDNKPEKAQAYLILREDGNVLSLNLLSSEMNSDMQIKTCQLLKAISKRRSKYISRNFSDKDSDVARTVATILKNPSACSISSASATAKRTEPKLERPLH